MTSGFEAQQQAFNRLGVQLYRTLQPGEDRIVCDAAAVGDHAVVRLEVAGGTGRVVAASQDVVDAVRALRAACADPGKGTWFGLRAEVTSGGAASVSYDWDREPELDVDDPELWLRDHELFPRDPGNTPSWLAARLAEAEQARSTRASDPRQSMSLTLDLSGESGAPVAESTEPAEPAEPDFVGVIRAAMEADPTNLGLRVDLIELLLEQQPEVAAVEIETLNGYGANPQTVQVLRARAAAALTRKRHGPAGSTSAAPSAPPSAPPSAAPTAPPTAAPSPRTDRIESRGRDGDEGVPVWDIERPGVNLADVAGLEEVKKHLHASFLAPMRNPELAKMFGKAPRGSLLMYGPPGCGKTFIARAVAGELGANFLHATLADLMSQWMGQTEKAIHALFEAARAARPCVIFFDEFDAIGGRRTSGSSGSAQALRMVASQLLEEFDGVAASNDGIYVLAATNRPWDIDPALRRPGRLDRTVLILPPDEPARDAIIRNALRDKPAAAIDTADVAKKTTEFSGADISYVVNTAVEAAFMDSLQAGVPRMITTYDLENAVRRITPSTRSWFEQIKPVLEYGVDDGTFGQLRSYLKKHRI